MPTVSIPMPRPHRDRGIEGRMATWYAANTGKSMQPFQDLAQRIAIQLPQDARVLEVAPGPGYFAIELAKLGDFQITGLDISETFVEIAHANAANAGVQVDFRRGNASAMPFPDNTFDFLLCRAAFKNFSEPTRALQEMHRVLKPGGRALIIDLRRDASRESIRKTVDAMKLGVVNGTITKLTFRFMLLKRAYTKSEIEEMIGWTPFRDFEIQEDLIGMEIVLRKETEAVAAEIPAASSAIA